MLWILLLCVFDLEVQFNGETRNAPTLCVSHGKEVIPLTLLMDDQS